MPTLLHFRSKVQHLESNTCKPKGFTLIELLIVIAIISVLSALGAVAYSRAQMKARDTQRKSALFDMASALQVYHNDRGYYPCFRAGPCSSWAWAGWAPPATTTIETYHLSPSSGPKYIVKVPIDPKGINTCGEATATKLPYLFVSSISGEDYTLFTLLENTNDPQATAVKPPPKGTEYISFSEPLDGYKKFKIGAGSCGGFTYNYWVTNP